MFQCHDGLGDKRDQSGCLFFMHTGPVFLTLVTIELAQLLFSASLVFFFFSLRVGFSSSTWTECKKQQKTHTQEVAYSSSVRQPCSWKLKILLHLKGRVPESVTKVMLSTKAWNQLFVWMGEGVAKVLEIGWVTSVNVILWNCSGCLALNACKE